MIRDRIMSRHRSGEGYQNISAALKVPKNTVASNILKCKTFGTTKTLPRAGHPAKLSQSVEKGHGQEGDQEPDGHSDKALEFLCGDGRNFQKDYHLC
uniref:Sleeping Beauty transposase HTH domain-containing protein n=1 Tax=Oncorhynchus tshawytscha TaxID=74940 RepID=A0AAZ3QNX6_ONCTS